MNKFPQNKQETKLIHQIRMKFSINKKIGCLKSNFYCHTESNGACQSVILQYNVILRLAQDDKLCLMRQPLEKSTYLSVYHFFCICFFMSSILTSFNSIPHSLQLPALSEI